MVSRMWVEAVVVVAVLVGGGRCEDRWVWGKSSSNNNNNSKASSIPGYVEPSSTSTTPPPVTTFRPPFRPLGRAAPRLHDYPRASANPLFLGSFEPFSVVPVRKPRPAQDGTTKSRVTADAAFDGASGAVLDAGDKYTTLDRLQSERGALPPLPRPKKHQLGGLHPDEVFYADDDLLIIKGGGFNSDAFEEPPQPLDADEEDPREGSASRVSSVVAPLPSPHQEYNGNIPAIVPPPERNTNHPLSLFVGEGSDNNYLLVPYVLPQLRADAVLPAGPVTNHLFSSKNTVRRSTVYPYVFPPPYITHAQTVRRPFKPQVSQLNKKETFRPPNPNTLQLPHSLAGDTDVNYRFPRPPVNPDAELFSPVRQHYYYPGRFRQQGRPRL